ncbi:MAG: PQQ-binding-like beta-propeller repeat protein [Pseudomonadota bacterium]|nr:PQQ-binding-like beta-propeller repeat protein [Pseudomonadota bacterium]
MMPRHSLFIASLVLALAVGGCSWMPSWMGGKKEEKPKLEGERIAVLPVSAGYKADESLKDTPVVLPQAAANADWSQHSGAVTSASGNLAGGAFDAASHAEAGKGNAFETTRVPPPVVAGGTVFAMDAAGYVSAHDAAHIGTLRWTSPAVSEEDAPLIMDGGLAFADGKLYAASGRGIVAALDAASGKELWRKSLLVPLHGSPRVADGKVFVLTLDDQAYALNAENGEVAWNHRGIGETAELMSGIAPVAAGGLVLIPYSSGELYGLASADGKEIWSDAISGGARTQATAFFSGIGGDPVVDGSVVLAVSSGGKMSAIALSNGRPLWERPIGSINTPWLAGDYLFVLTSDNTLLCLFKYDGRIRWATKLKDFANAKEKKDPIAWRGPALVDGKLAVIGSNGQLVLVSATDGSIVATKEIAENIYTPPVIADGRMYLLGQDATLYELH